MVKVRSWRGHSCPPENSLTCVRWLGATLRTREKRPSVSDATERPWSFSQRPPKLTISLRLTIQASSPRWRYQSTAARATAPSRWRCWRRASVPRRSAPTPRSTPSIKRSRTRRRPSRAPSSRRCRRWRSPRRSPSGRRSRRAARRARASRRATTPRTATAPSSAAARAEEMAGGERHRASCDGLRGRGGRRPTARGGRRWAASMRATRPPLHWRRAAVAARGGASGGAPCPSTVARR